MSHEKLCIFCQHFRFNKPYREHTTATGDFDMPGNLKCNRNHLDELELCMEDDQEFEESFQYRRIILTAKKCPDYQQVQA